MVLDHSFMRDFRLLCRKLATEIPYLVSVENSAIKFLARLEGKVRGLLPILVLKCG